MQLPQLIAQAVICSLNQNPQVMKKLLLIGLMLTAYAAQAQTPQPSYEVTPGNGNGLRFWSNGSQNNLYKIHMGNTHFYKWGPVQDYSIKSNMYRAPSVKTRGWTWGSADEVPVAALNTQGTMQIAQDFRALGKIGAGDENPQHRLSVKGSETPRTLGTYKGSAVQITNSYANTFGANTELQFGVGAGSQNLAVIAAQYTSYGNGRTAGALIFGTQHTDASGTKERMRILSNGNIGIGTSNSAAKLTIEKWSDVETDKLLTLSHKASFGGLHNSWNFVVNTSGYLRIESAFQNKALLIHPNGSGSVGIATECVPGNAKLAVGGKILCEEVEVRLKGSNCWADYVFENDYELRPLAEVEDYIEENKHLPGIPSTQELEENGLNVNEMLKLQMEKIEELTLYILEQEARISELENAQ